MSIKHILVVDDDKDILSLLSYALRKAKFQVTIINDSEEALLMLVNNCNTAAPIDLLVTDFDMPKLTGLDIIDALRNEGIKLPSFLMSGHHEGIMASEAQSRGCIGFIKKPFKLSVLIDRIHQVFESEPESKDIQDCGMCA